MKFLKYGNHFIDGRNDKDHLRYLRYLRMRLSNITDNATPRAITNNHGHKTYLLFLVVETSFLFFLLTDTCGTILTDAFFDEEED